jgi:hypothetical protein
MVDQKRVDAHVRNLLGWTGINPIRKAEERKEEARTQEERDLWNVVIDGILKAQKQNSTS